MVNLVFRIGKYARMNLPGELTDAVAVDGGSGTLRVLVTRRKDIDWMVDQALVGAPCRVEYPDKAQRNAVIQSVSGLKEGFLLEGRFSDRPKKEVKQ